MTKPIDEKEINLKVKDLDGLLLFLRSKSQERIIKKANSYYRGSDESYFVRLEDIEDETGHHKAFTIKYGFNDSEDGMNRRKELTIPVEDTKDFETVLQVMGFTCTSRKSKTRHAFEIDGLEVTVDEWATKELGNRLEIEGHDEAAIWQFKTQIESYIK